MSDRPTTPGVRRRAYRLAVLRGYAAVLGMIAVAMLAAWANNPLAVVLWLAGAAFWPFFWRSSRQTLPTQSDESMPRPEQP